MRLALWGRSSAEITATDRPGADVGACWWLPGWSGKGHPKERAGNRGLKSGQWWLPQAFEQGAWVVGDRLGRLGSGNRMG